MLILLIGRCKNASAHLSVEALLVHGSIGTQYSHHYFLRDMDDHGGQEKRILI